MGKKSGEKRGNPSRESESLESSHTSEREAPLSPLQADTTPAGSIAERPGPPVLGTIEDMESSNEELKASNEEIQIFQEELRSLQEELSTVYNQLHDKVQDLELARSDLDNLLDCTDIATIFLDTGFRIRRFGPVSTRLFNLVPTDVGRSIGDIVKRFTDDDLLRDAQRVLHERIPREKEVRTEDGRWCLRRVTPYRTQDSRIDGVIVTLSDVSHLKLADEQMRRLATFVRDSNDAVIVHDFEGRITAWNRGAERMYGYSEDEALAMNVMQLVPENLWAGENGVWQRLARGEKIESWERQGVTKDGHILETWVTLTVLTDESGKPNLIAKTERNITQRKEMERELRLNEKRLRLALSAGSMGTWDWDFVTDSVTWDSRQFELFGIHPDEFDGNSALILSRIQPDDRPRVEAAIAETRARGTPFREEFGVQCPDGSIRWLAGFAQLLSNGGDSSRIIGMNFDVTERKRAEQTLRASEEAFRSFFDNVAVGTVQIDGAGHFVRVNHRYCEITGYSREELLNGMGPLDLSHPDDRETDRQALDEYMRGKKPRYEVEKRYLRKDGRIRWVQVAATAIRDVEGAVRFSAGVVEDITERKEAADDVVRQLAAIVENSADAIFMKDLDGTVLTWNKSAERLFGFTTDELIGRSILATVPEERMVEWTSAMSRLARGEHVEQMETERVRKGGRRFPVAVTYSALSNGTGKTVGVSAIVRDITRRKELEREVVEVASQEQRRIGQDLHDTVAQELTALNLLARDLPDVLRTDPAEGAKLLERLAQGLQRSQQELRAVLRGLLPVAVEKEGLMAALADLAERTQRDGKVKCAFDCHIPVTVADNLVATHLYLIAQEAVHNALRHARPTTIRIGLKSNHHLVLCVQDDGVGISTETQKNPGLGLRIMRNRAAIINATLTIGPAEPKGTVVVCSVEDLR